MKQSEVSKLLDDMLGDSTEKILSNHIVTIAGETFAGADSARLAALIYRRFGRDRYLALSKWQAMLGNNCTLNQYLDLVTVGMDLEGLSG